MSKQSFSKALITGEQITESPDMPGGQGPGPGRPMRRMVRGGPPGETDMPDQPQGKFSPRERKALQELVILDLLHALGNDPFYSAIAEVALKNVEPDQTMIQHFRDEAPKYAAKMSPELNEFMGKLFSAT